MELELSFGINLENTFCESSFIVVHKSVKRRSIPSIKRLDLQLSKIRTTLTRKISLKKRKLSFNIDSTQLDSTIANIIQSADKYKKQSNFVKNTYNHKKSTCSAINKRILKSTNCADTATNLVNDFESAKQSIQQINLELNKQTAKRPRMGITSLNKTSPTDATKPSVAPLPFLEQRLMNKSSKPRVSLCNLKSLRKK
ncbi:hypothetical protein BpHYR1_002680 [Brachionus plicatilis]|uniref:Uncharacterized protein n=1 Tax=Brachionus plicatilis TaxID=10195 RepID=A0A3M7PMF8_BRAPC|nr:hypothetical protein BpHYR1_002680 [Brachionus plicatilis]